RDVACGGSFDAAVAQLVADLAVVEPQRSVACEPEAYRDDRPLAALRVPEDAVAIAEAAIDRVEPPVRTVEQRDGVQRFEALAHLDAVGADVLDRARADAAGDQRKVLEPAEALRERPVDEFVPVL